MYVISKKVELTANKTAEIKITTPKDWTLGYIVKQYYTPDPGLSTLLGIKATYDTNKISEDYYFDLTKKRSPLPIFNAVETKNSIKVEITNYDDSSRSHNLAFIFYNKNEINVDEIEKLNFRRRAVLADPLPATTESDLTIWKNTTGHKVYMQLLRQATGSFEYAQIYIENRKVFDTYLNGNATANINYDLFTKAWINPNETVWMHCYKKYPTEGWYWAPSALLTDEEYTETELPLIAQVKKSNVFTLPKIQSIIEENKPQIVIESPYMDERINPYPTPQDQRGLLIQTMPTIRSIRTTSRYNQNIDNRTQRINRKEESAVVEGIISPFGVLRKSADAMGRLRTTGVAITYTNDTLSVTDANAHTVWTGYGSKKITLRATAEDWTIKVLPLYNWLSGKAITDMGDITLKAGQQIEWDLETREIQATCPTGSGTVTGELDWEVDV